MGVEILGEKLAQLVPVDFKSYRVGLASICSLNIEIKGEEMQVIIDFHGVENLPDFTARLTIRKTEIRGGVFTWGVIDHVFEGPPLGRGEDFEEKYKEHLRGLHFLRYTPFVKISDLERDIQWQWLQNIVDSLPIPDSVLSRFKSKYALARVIGQAIFEATIPVV